MHNRQNRHGSQQRKAGHGGHRQANSFRAACASVFGLSSVATAITEGEQHNLCYVNPAFLELAGQSDMQELGRPLVESFPELVPLEARALLDRVRHDCHAASNLVSAPFSHARRGQLYLALQAWPCGRADLMTVVQFGEVTNPAGKDGELDEFARVMRAVNEGLLLAGVEQHDLAQEATRRRVVAEEAAERSESALQSNVEQTQSLARRLISAQEVERMRLARELHDDVNQQLAGLSIAMSTLRAGLPENAETLRLDLDRLQQRTTVLIDTIRDLSHELHPGSLRNAGLLPALQHLCAETGKRNGAIEFHTTGELNNLPADVSLTLYRVAQEALRNVTQHAQARHTMVVLIRDSRRIRLQISDDGRGFIRQDSSGGLGLLSMEERVLGVNGALTIDSIPGAGTRLELSIPSASSA